MTEEGVRLAQITATSSRSYIPRYTSSVHSFLAGELDIKLAMFDLVTGTVLKHTERVFEDILPSNVDIDRSVVLALTLIAIVQSREEIAALVLEFEHLRVVHQDREAA